LIEEGPSFFSTDNFSCKINQDQKTYDCGWIGSTKLDTVSEINIDQAKVVSWKFKKEAFSLDLASPSICRVTDEEGGKSIECKFIADNQYPEQAMKHWNDPELWEFTDEELGEEEREEKDGI